MTKTYDLSKLSREEKLALLEALEEKKRRDKEKRPPYKPHSGQLEVHRSRAFNRFVFAGNGSGKTALGTNELLWAVNGYNPVTGEKTKVPCRAFIILDRPEKLDTVIIPEIRKWTNIKPEQLLKRGKPYVSRITFDNGSTITPIFWDQDPMTAEGIEGDFFWYDEPSPRPLFISLKRAGRTKGHQARYLFTGTPISAPWLRTEIYERWTKGELPDTECFRFPTDMNKDNLAEGYIEQFSRVLTEKEQGIRLRGEFFDLDGLALSHLFRQETHVIQRDEFHWDMSWPTVLAIDVHPSKKNYAVLLGADRDNRLYVLKEIARKETARQFARTLKEWMKGYRVIDMVCDSLGSADMTGGEGFKSFIQILNEEGVRVRATTFEEKEDEAFISRIQDSLLIPDAPDNFGQYVPKLRVLSNCTMLISDIRQVQWVRDKNNDTNKPKLDISNKDALSCLKYALATSLFFEKTIKNQPHYVAKQVYGLPKRNNAKMKLRSVSVKRPVAADDDDW